MTAFTFAVDANALATHMTIFVLSMLLGAAIAVAGTLFFGFAKVAVGIVETIAGGNGRVSATTGSDIAFVSIRTIFWAALIFLSFVLVLLGWPWTGHICVIIGGICLPIATFKLIVKT